jgi:Fe-Mn family superoxide dismutase
MKSSAARSPRHAHHFDLPPLPYATDALAPVISAETLHFHHDKHHRKYVDTMNQLLQQEPVEGSTLEEIVRNSSGKLFNNAAQAWNHDFYWHSLAPAGSVPSPKLLEQIERDFGSLLDFNKKLATAASGQFGSGWAWLIHRAGKLEIVTTSNADTPMARNIPCLLTIDVWEHAYYIDYRNDRDKYLSGLIDSRLNWEFAERNFRRASAD